MGKTKTTKSSGLHVALLRGINVGGRKKLPMKQLAELFGDAGACDVRTHIQSGNVIFRASQSVAKRAAGLVASAIVERFGFEVPVVIRTAKELQRVARDNPFLRSGAEVAALHVLFLDKMPTAARVGALDPGRSPPDELLVRGREIYLRCPNGIGRSKLTVAYFEAKLATTSTIRNYRTVLKLVELATA